MEFIIDRQKWFRGSVVWHEEYLTSMLYVLETRTYCCLGLIAKNMGVSQKRCESAYTPADLQGKIPRAYRDIFLRKTDWGETGNSVLALDAMSINDDEEISEKLRERRLRQLFKKCGHTITFVN